MSVFRYECIYFTCFGRIDALNSLRVGRYNLKKVTKPRLVDLFRVNVATFSVLWFVVRVYSKNVCFFKYTCRTV